MKLSRVALAAVCCALFATQPNDATRRWWSHVVAMGGDDMGGRDTGSEGYRKAARYVAGQFEKAGLKPAGEHGYYQTVPLHVVRLNTVQSKIELVRPSGVTELHWLRQVTTAARADLPQKFEVPMVFAGSDLLAADLEGKVAVQMSRPGGRGAAEAGAGRGAGTESGRGGPRTRAAAIFTVDAAGGPEPPRWPVAYSVAMTIRGVPPAGRGGAQPLTFRFNHNDADLLFAQSGHSYSELLALQAAGKPLPKFPMNITLRGAMKTESADLDSDNILAVLPGSDPALASEYVVVSAHLDGYGHGEPWNGDNIYNGAFDDEAYVATLIDFAERLHESGAKPKRSILFCVVTAEEKGLLGSKYFTAHPTVPKEKIVADINLDQLRPIFPLKTLTMLAIDESTLGDTVKKVAAPMNIRIQPDPEPERNLLRRSDHYSFMQIGVPATGFIFGYEKGSREEEVYRHWYAERYHSPADDLKQPWDPPAAAKFNDFFHNLVLELADAPERPRWNPSSQFAKEGNQ